MIPNTYWQEHFPNKPAVILDGALSTELEKRGFDISGSLWSARLLMEAPESIQRLHLDYLIAGADIITTASYQASFPGFQKYGINDQKARQLMHLSIRLAKEARQQFRDHIKQYKNRNFPLIAASVGPYGAYLADGSEYRGNYGRTVKELIDFHRLQVEALLEEEPDLIAFETIPSRVEAEAIVRLLEDYPSVRGWLSFSCIDRQHISDGESIQDCIKDFNAMPQLVALGVNCTPPEYIEPLIKAIATVSEKAIIVYPNSGEGWDAQQKCWLPVEKENDFNQLALKWQKAGAKVIGGCCRTGVGEVRKLRELFVNG